MVKDKEEVRKSFERWIIQTAREQDCYDNEIAVIAYDYLKDTRYF